MRGIEVRGDHCIRHFLALHRKDGFRVDALLEHAEGESTAKRRALAVLPVTGDDSLEAIGKQRSCVAVAFLGSSLFDQRESTRRTRLAIQCEYRMSRRPGAGERVENQPIRWAPQLNDLREQAQRLDGVEPMPPSDDRIQLRDTGLTVARLSVFPRRRTDLERLAVVFVRPKGRRDESLTHVLEIALECGTGRATLPKVETRPWPVLQDLRCTAVSLFHAAVED